MNPALAHPFYIALKASLAALAALALVELFGIRDRLSATFVAVVCISPTVYTGLRRGLEQIGASALGGGVTWALTLVLPRAPALVVGLFVTIWVCFRLGFARAFLVAAFTVVYVLLIPGDSISHTLEHRLASVAIGVFCANALNLVISFATYKSTFARRMRIARAEVGAAFVTLCELLARPARPEDDPVRASLFEGVFPLLRALADELGDAVRESRLRGGDTKARMEATQRETHELLAVAHHGKDVVLLLREGAGPFPNAAVWAKAFGEAVVARAAAPALSTCEEPPRAALFRAGQAYEAARALPSLDATGEAP